MDKAEAKADFERALSENKDDPDIYYHRAQFHFIEGEYQDASADYQRSIDLDKDFVFSHIQLGVTQYKQGSIASSMATFRRTIKNFERIADVYNYYGELLLDQQQYQKAIDQFETAIDLEKSLHPTGINVLPIINKALAKFQWKQDHKEARDLCEKALLCKLPASGSDSDLNIANCGLVDPECDIAVATMAQLLLHKGDVTEALKYFERAAQLSRTEGEIVNALQYAEASRTQLEVSFLSIFATRSLLLLPPLAKSIFANAIGFAGRTEVPSPHSTHARERRARWSAHVECEHNLRKSTNVNHPSRFWRSRLSSHAK